MQISSESQYCIERENITTQTRNFQVILLYISTHRRSQENAATARQEQIHPMAKKSTKFAQFAGHRSSCYTHFASEMH